MKQSFLFAVVILALSASSCRKTYTCSCTNTITVSIPGFGSIPLSAKTENKEYEKKMTEKQAKAACDHEKITIQSIAENALAADPSAGMADIDVATKCSLK